MSGIKVHGGVKFLGTSSEIQNLELEQSDTDPTNPNVSRIWYNTTDKQIKYAESIEPFIIRGLLNNTDLNYLIGLISEKSNSGTTLLDYGITDALKRTGDSMSGSLSLPKESGFGLQIDGSFGWKDLIGDITPRDGTPQAPALKVLTGSIREWAYSANDQCDCRFHIPHDYAPGTDLYIHLHWSHNGTNIAGSLNVLFNVTYAKGHQQAVFSNTISNTLIVSGLNITNTPKLMHRVDETALSVVSGNATLLDTNLIEVDGLILINYTVTSIPSISGSDVSNTPYILGLDIHYQSTGITTKNKTPNFYG